MIYLIAIYLIKEDIDNHLFIKVYLLILHGSDKNVYKLEKIYSHKLTTTKKIKEYSKYSNSSYCSKYKSFQKSFKL